MSSLRRWPRRPGFGAIALALSVASAPPSSATAQVSTNQSPPAVTPVPISVDPATSSFTTEAGVILITIKPSLTADYELVIRTLQEGLAKDTDQARRAAAKGWRVFKAAEPDGKGNAVYVHLMWPAVAGFDYRPSLLVDALVTDLVPELLTKYQDSIAGAPSKLSLTELANMAVAPLPPGEPKKPGGRE